MKRLTSLFYLIQLLLLQVSTAKAVVMQVAEGPLDLENGTEQDSYTVIINGKWVGHLKVDRNCNEIGVDYDFKNNGRGPTTTEMLTVDDAGIPVSWSISGNSTFGNTVEETYALRAKKRPLNWSGCMRSTAAFTRSKFIAPSTTIGYPPWLRKHMPAAFQRNTKVALLNVADEEQENLLVIC